MASFDEEEDLYIIPHNYQENGKILGIIDKQSFYIGIAWILFWFVISYLVPMDLTIKIVAFAVIALLPGGIIFVGFGHDTVVEFAKYYLNFNKNAKVYYYEK